MDDQTTDRRAKYRTARQVIPGRDLTAPSDPIDYAGRYAAGGPGDLPYFVGLSALVLLSAVFWAIWGMGAATPLLLGLGIALIAARFLL